MRYTVLRTSRERKSDREYDSSASLHLLILRPIRLTGMGQVFAFPEGCRVIRSRIRMTFFLAYLAFRLHASNQSHVGSTLSAA